MGNIIKAVHDDIKHYKWLCKRYKEEIEYSETAQGVRVPNCYGKHAAKLQRRLNKENEEKNG